MSGKKRKSINLIPDPGPLPTRQSPKVGDRIRIKVLGLPPDKDESFSIRNPRHRRHQRFMDLRRAAITAMAGRKHYLGPIELNLTIYAQHLDRSIPAYLGGILDALDGSHGFTYTYLPIVYEDDFQIEKTSIKHKAARQESYTVSIKFLKYDRKPRIPKEMAEQLSKWKAESRKTKRPFRPTFRRDDG
jgi:hypothetical protein